MLSSPSNHIGHVINCKYILLQDGYVCSAVMVTMLLLSHASPVMLARNIVSCCFNDASKIVIHAIIEDTLTVFGGIRSCVSCPSGTSPDITGFNCVGQTVSDVLCTHRHY